MSLFRASVPARICLQRAPWAPSSLSPPTFCPLPILPTVPTISSRTMSLLLIPGPIEVTDEVLYANAHPSMSHISPDFISVFGDAIRMTREVLFTKDAQPFLIAGSGTLGWDQVSANLVEPGESALVLNTGYFGDSFADCLRTYGATVDELQAPFGGTVPLAELEAALKAKKYKIVTFTHVDTSTGVLSDAKTIAATVRSASPDTLVVADAVCSVASEEIRFDTWGLDVVLTASQKGLGAPPTFESRKSPVTSYYASWKKWLPIMQAYESGNAAYFATPPVNLIYAYHASLKQITKSSVSLEERLRLHKESSQRFKKAAEGLGLKQLPLEGSVAANGMTALWFPEGLGASDLLPPLAKRNVVVAGGLHKDHKLKYFRIGHMGVSAIDGERGDLDTVLAALTDSLAEAKTKKA
ncbi:hypothetical protein V8D89_016104 [Ganoderma adspersum]